MGGGHRDLMLAMKILGIFRCVCPVAMSGRKKESVEEIISTPADLGMKKSRLIISMSLDTSEEHRDTHA